MLLLLFTGTAGNTGTLSVTEANDTASATGSVALKGQGSITEAADTLSGAATLPIKGTASLTEAADNLSSAATLLINGLLSVTEAHDALSATGILPIAGTLSVMEAGDTVSTAGVGQVAITGSLNVTEASDVLSAAAALSITGAVSAAEAGDTLAATATVADAPAPLIFAHVGGDDPRLIQERRQREWQEDLRRIIDRSFLVASGIIDPVTHQPIPTSDYSAVVDGLLAQALSLDREHREGFIAERERCQEEEALVILLLAA